MATVLVIDDDAFARGFFEAALTAAGYAVVLASGVDEGLLATAKDVGADITLRKPVPAHGLVDAVESLLTEPS